MPRVELDDRFSAGAETHGFVPQLYIARPEERLIRKKIGEREKWGTISHPVVELYSSVPDIGKTWLLRALEAEHTLQGEFNLPRPSITAFVDLETFGQKHLVLQELTRQINISLPEKDQIAHPAGVNEGDEDSIAKNLVAKVLDLVDRHIPVLLFDNITSTDENFASWLEQSIVDPLARRGQVLLIFSGDASIRWKNFEVRRRVEAVTISAFDREQTDSLLTKSNRNISRQEKDAVFHFTAGLPSAMARVLELLRENNGQVDGKFAESVYKTIVEEQLLKEVPEKSKQFLSVIASIRKFSPTLLRHFYAKFLGPEYREETETFYLDVLRDRPRLVRWDEYERGYYLHPVVRKIMDRNLEVRDPDRFLRHHSGASELYQGWINKYPRNGIGFLLELIYHQAQTLNVRKQPLDDLVRLFAKNLDFLETAPDNQWDLPDIAEFLFQKLGATTPGEDIELAEALGPELWERIRNSAKGFLKHRSSFLD